MSVQNSLLEQEFGSPIFICGVARSGTTLLLSLLDCHPELNTLPEETYFYRQVLSRRFASVAFRAAEYALNDRLTRMIGRKFWRHLIATDKGSLQDHLFVWAKSVSSLDTDICAESARAQAATCDGPDHYWQCYLELYQTLQNSDIHGRRFWVEKTPSNERFTGLIDAQFGSTAQYLHIVRDPRDVAASRLLRSVTAKADRRRFLLSICQSWAMSVHLATINTGIAPDRYRCIRYEDLVRDPKNVMCGVANHLGISFNAILLTPTRRGELRILNTSHPTIHDGGAIVSTQIGRHPEVLSTDEIGYIENMLDSQMTAYGYVSEMHSDNCPSPRHSTMDSMVQTFKDALKRMQIKSIQKKVRNQASIS